MGNLKIGIHHLNLKYIFESGQFFRWKTAGEKYFAASGDNVFNVWQDEDTLYYEGVSEKFIRNFFRLDDDLSEILLSIGRDDLIKKAVRAFPGLRLLRQDPWECLVSFMCSPCSNIGRITKNVNDIAMIYGRKVIFNGGDFHLFPPVGRLDDGRIGSIKLGFRAERIAEMSRFVDDRFLAGLRGLSYENAKKMLLRIKGIGEKIADCILLFSGDYLNAFPSDVWMIRGIGRHYFNEGKINAKQCAEFGRKYFGPYAGYAQQYLYFFFRERSPLK